MSTPADDAGAVTLGDVPLFPLPNVVLFPKAVQPLHVFEERYKAMTADAVKGDGRIAMALLRPGWEKCYYSQPAIEPVVCVGRIISVERLADGKYNFLLRGEARAVVTRERGDLKPYRVAQVRAMEEVAAPEDALDASRRRLKRLFERSPIGHTPAGRQFRGLIEGDLATPTLIDLLAFTYVEDVALKQSLLADPDVQRRAGHLVDALLATQPVLQSAYFDSLADPTLN